MGNITITKPKPKQKPLQVVNQAGDLFESFAAYKGMKDEGLSNLRSETAHILSFCNKHDDPKAKAVTHLAFGYVQSGKTMSFTALTAMARDNGYRLIFYLAGIANNLYEQTYDRLRGDLFDRDSHHYRMIKEDGQMAKNIQNAMLLSKKPIMLVPILKHHGHINKLAKVCESDTFKNAMKGETVIIIDDEADQASLNNYGYQNSKTGEFKMSSTYEAIMKLRLALPGHSYVQYTATPQAQILISIDDILSPKSHTVLSPGAAYTGGKLFFKNEPAGIVSGSLIKVIPEEEAYHVRHNDLDKMPKSLHEALWFHVMSTAIIVHLREDEKIKYLSMMVHPDQPVKSSKKFLDWVDDELERFAKVLKKPDGQDAKKRFLKELKENIYPEVVKYMDESEKPTFEEILPFMSDAINDRQLHYVNSKKDGEKEIDWSLGSMHILFGAQLLNRGFTINNLSTTYMPRHTVGVATADTIEQRCRFFGYKMHYIKSCRVYLPEPSIQNYVDYVDNEEELRKVLKDYETLKEAGHALMSSPNLQQCRKNVLPSNLVKTTMDGNCKMEAFDTPEVIDDNNKLAEAFIKKLVKEKNDYRVLYKNTTKQREHRVWDLTIDEAVNFLLDFRFASVAEAVRRDNTVRYIKYLAAWPGCKIDHVEFMQMAYDGKPMHRAFNPTKAKIKSTFYTGADKDATIYPGDQNVTMSEDTITIQLYNFELSPSFPNRPTAHTLSINYPEKLSTAYCTNNQEVEDIDPLFNEVDEEYESNS